MATDSLFCTIIEDGSPEIGRMTDGQSSGPKGMMVERGTVPRSPPLWSPQPFLRRQRLRKSKQVFSEATADAPLGSAGWCFRDIVCAVAVNG